MEQQTEQQFVETANTSEKVFGNNRFQETIAAHEATIAEKDKIIGDLNSKIQEEIGAHKETKTKLEQIEGTLRQVQSDLTIAQGEVNNQKSTNTLLQNNVTDLQKQLDAKQQLHEESLKSSGDLESALIKTKSDLAILTELHETLQSSVARKDALIKESNDTLLIVQKEIEMNNVLIQKLEQEKEYLKESISKLSSTNETLQSTVESQSQEIKVLHTKMSTPEPRVSGYRPPGISRTRR
ncbi:hypothetical protein EB118_21650 [bacterium]|nr:hypothetical protein [bacterium]NDD83056.1 hypothetical protein [bacterium]NDG32665.1 hypothetical protein [bacterium]